MIALLLVLQELFDLLILSELALEVLLAKVDQRLRVEDLGLTFFELLEEVVVLFVGCLFQFEGLFNQFLLFIFYLILLVKHLNLFM